MSLTFDLSNFILTNARKPVLPTLFLFVKGTCEELFSRYCSAKKKKKPNCLIKVCLAYLLSKMACAWTMFWLLSLSIIMLSSSAGLIEVLHHRSEGIFFFSNWSDAFILGIMHRQQYITFFSTYLFFIFYFIIFIILLSLCGIGAPHRKCHELFMYKTDFALFGSPFAKNR